MGWGNLFESESSTQVTSISATENLNLPLSNTQTTLGGESNLTNLLIGVGSKNLRNVNPVINLNKTIDVSAPADQAGGIVSAAGGGSSGGVVGALTSGFLGLSWSTTLLLVGLVLWWWYSEHKKKG
jgi:hypothetical protein